MRMPPAFYILVVLNPSSNTLLYLSIIRVYMENARKVSFKKIKIIVSNTKELNVEAFPTFSYWY